MSTSDSALPASDHVKEFIPPGFEKRHLVVCCDGTWNVSHNKWPTNIGLSARALCPVSLKGHQQMVFYYRGVGTSDTDAMLGGAFGTGFDAIVRDAYLSLSMNWLPGSEIYIFGYSRGAYIARVLANLICSKGLIAYWNVRKVHTTKGNTPGTIKESENRTQRRRSKGSPPWLQGLQALYDLNEQKITIKCLGVWDTVKSLGPLTWWRTHRKYYSAKVPSGVEFAFHAIAINERRRIFNVLPCYLADDNRKTILKEVWFPGVHGSVGGGNQNDYCLSIVTCMWMMEQIHNNTDLRFNLD